MEQELIKPLSGSEIKEILVKAFRQALDRDMFLADYVTFPRFSASIAWDALLIGSSNSTVKAKISVSSGVDPGPGAETQLTGGTEAIPEGDPNVIRKEYGVGVPVLTKDQKGRTVEKLVNYGEEKVVDVTQQDQQLQADTMPQPHGGVVVPGADIESRKAAREEDKRKQEERRADDKPRERKEKEKKLTVK